MRYKHALNKKDAERLDALYQKLKTDSETFSGYLSSLCYATKPR